MGRRTFDVVSQFEGEWPYGDTPILVATRRPLAAKRASVRGVQGDIPWLLAEAKSLAAGRDVYVDGGQLVLSTLNAGLLDELTLSVVPILLGEGISVFGGAVRQPLELSSTRPIGGGMVELCYTVSRTAGPASGEAARQQVEAVVRSEQEARLALERKLASLRGERGK